MSDLPTNKAKRMSAGKRDLSKAVKKVHQKPKRKKPDEAEVDLSTYPEHLFLAAGDMENRATYFDFNDKNKPIKGNAGLVYVQMSRAATLADYRDANGARKNRSMITIPPKLRESLRELFAAEKDDEFALTTALVALADYGAMVLKRDKKLLMIEPAHDPFEEQRKDLRRLTRKMVPRNRST